MNRRDFFKNSSLIAVGSVVPEFLARTALAAEPGKDNILVVLEMTGGNDGLNTVIPYTDPLYYKNRPTLGVSKTEVVKIDDTIGLHPRLNGLRTMIKDGELAVVQGVGYPNPDRSHFESMDVWHSADPKRQINTGWIGRCVGNLPTSEIGFQAMQVGPGKAPLILQGGSGGIISLGDPQSFDLQLSGPETQAKARKKLLDDLNSQPGDPENLAAFVQRRQLQTLQAVSKIREALKDDDQSKENGRSVRRGGVSEDIGKMELSQKLNIVARLIRRKLGARVFYVSIDGFDTHSGQADDHANLMLTLGSSISSFFNELKEGGFNKNVLLMTYSEFGRRVKENGSKGTDHGAASCMFVAGPGAKGGAVGKHPRLDDLDDGDLKFSIDFRRVYATLLDQWLGCDSKAVLGGKFEHVELLAKAPADRPKEPVKK